MILFLRMIAIKYSPLNSRRSRASGLARTSRGLGLVPGRDDRCHVRGESGRRYLAPESREEWNWGDTSHAPGGRPPHREPVRFPAAVASPRWGALEFLTFRRTNHDHDH